MIVNDSKEKHVCNDEGNYIITKEFSFDDVNDTFLLDQLWPCMLCLNGVTHVRPIVKKWNFFIKQYITYIKRISLLNDIWNIFLVPFVGGGLLFSFIF